MINIEINQNRFIINAGQARTDQDRPEQEKPG
jgi:hypothetical protein